MDLRSHHWLWAVGHLLFLLFVALLFASSSPVAHLTNRVFAKEPRAHSHLLSHCAKTCAVWGAGWAQRLMRGRAGSRGQRGRLGGGCRGGKRKPILVMGAMPGLCEVLPPTAQVNVTQDSPPWAHI